MPDGTEDSQNSNNLDGSRGKTWDCENTILQSDVPILGYAATGEPEARKMPPADQSSAVDGQCLHVALAGIFQADTRQ